ncbi:hypothetical protein EVAR_39177_1 [Eumeta japonica]|uniref:Peptidase M14 domain-containing protein n=1 Tax=Eumeta variegata TaxID=151549 RepID=A0A4C1VP57_EUMVA|nr:hypothetical protein EVAR_39177_1 [Eumeta japonica]
MQIVKTGLCNVLLRVFDHWDRYQDRARLKICAHVLQTLLHLCNISTYAVNDTHDRCRRAADDRKSGRRALCTKKHVQALHRFCMQCPDEPEFDKLLAQVCAVITLCLKHQELPVPPTSPATFNLTPILKGTRALWPCKDDDDYDNNSDDKSDDADFEDLFPDLEGATEFTDDTDDTDFQKDDAISKSGDSLQNSMWLNSAERDIDDLKKLKPMQKSLEQLRFSLSPLSTDVFVIVHALAAFSATHEICRSELPAIDVMRRYSMYFKEFGPFNKQPRASKSRSNSRGSILDDLRNSQANTKSVSSSLLLPLSVSRESEHNPIQTKSNPSKLYESLSSTSTSSLKIHKDVSRFSSFEEVYTTLSSRVRSVIPFAKVAYPDLNGGHGLCKLEPLNVMERGACRAKLLSCVERAINPDSFQSEVVYDLDQICSLIGTSDKNGQKSVESQLLSNSDELDIRKSNSYPTRLAFESRFESGNLRKAIQIGPREYELILMPDVNSPKRHQWFYFEVRNMQQGRPYIFNIVNCEKSDSQFNFGMKPVLYSVKEAIFGRPGWVRAGSDICYYRNSYHYARQKHNKCYLTVTFNITFPHNNDVCYLAYHFPYTYSMLMTRIWQLSLSLPAHTHLRVEPLCYSLNNNEVPLLTVTAEDAQINPIAEREVIFLTARVHPGESNASWVMDGTLCRLLADTPDAAELRSKYVFKIVPMLNVEGVINGWWSAAAPTRRPRRGARRSPPPSTRLP